jgi:formylmethanofuran dehydrogenase subunit E
MIGGIMNCTPKSLIDAQLIAMDMLFDAMCSMPLVIRPYKPELVKCERCETRTSTPKWVNGENEAVCEDCYSKLDVKSCSDCDEIYEEEKLENPINENFGMVCSKCNETECDDTDLNNDYLSGLL